MLPDCVKKMRRGPKDTFGASFFVLEESTCRRIDALVGLAVFLKTGALPLRPALSVEWERSDGR